MNVDRQRPDGKSLRARLRGSGSRPWGIPGDEHQRPILLEEDWFIECPRHGEIDLDGASLRERSIIEGLVGQDAARHACGLCLRWATRVIPVEDWP